jgi:hypothetical protein
MPFDPLHFRPPPPPPDEPSRRSLSKREERLLMWCVCLWLAGMFLAPIGGSSVVQAIVYLMR